MASKNNQEDERLTKVEEQRKEALSENEKLYGGMVEKSDSFYQGLVDESKQWADTQSQIQQEQTDFVVEQIEQQKEQAKKDYTKEQKAAYRDWQKQDNAYGAQAEQMAANGLANTGFSETAKVGMYNTYQNRVATAKESLDKVILGYNNKITEAKLQNSSALAELAHTSLQQQLQFLLEGFQYKNSLLQEEANKKLTINSMYDSKYQAVVDQINTEKAFAEQQRQYNEQFKYQKEQDQKNYELQQAQFAYQKEQDQKNYEMQLRQMKLEEDKYKTEKEAYEIAEKEYQAELAAEKGAPGNNNAKTVAKDDYYFDGTTQPRYYENIRLTKSNLTAKILDEDLGIKSTNKIWKAGDKYVVWNHATKSYLDVTEEILFEDSKGQPKYIDNYKVTSAGTIKNTIGSYKNISTSQKVYKAGEKYFVWDSKKKTYLNVTSEYKKYLKEKKKKESKIVSTYKGWSGLW